MSEATRPPKGPPEPASPPRGEAREARFASTRLDKWLWAARFYKTRTLATNAIAAGHVRVAGERVKPARAVRVGERVQVRKGPLAWEVAVTALSEKRGSATDAAKLYAEDPASRAAREELIAKRSAAVQARFPGRPTKRDRRALDDFLNEP
jgi:ribosome-associated heat shock protein Hsp15